MTSETRTARQVIAEEIGKAARDYVYDTAEISADILAALAAAGWVVVPVEATSAMAEAGIDQGTDAGGALSYGDCYAIWRAMLAAARRG